MVHYQTVTDEFYSYPLRYWLVGLDVLIIHLLFEK